MLLSINAIGQILNPGDGVRITFFNISDNISGDYYIQQGGNLQLPYIGIIKTFEKDYTDIKKIIASKYDSLYKNPELSVQPLFKINILGEVRSPGYYFVTDIEKLSGIFALAGGVTADADIDGTYIIRGEREIDLNVFELLEAGNTAADFGLTSGDRIYVPRSFWADAGDYTIIFSAILVVATLAGIFLRN